MSELEQLTALCARLGAPGPQARTMAEQLLKRADQLAAERGMTRTAAMQHLIELVIKGRNGETPAAFSGNPPPRDERG